MQPTASSIPSVESGGELTIEVTDVVKRYGPLAAVDGVSLSVRRGEFFGILGPNGAGKTTLLEIIEGLREADSGTVRLLGESPWPRNSKLLPRIGVQLQASSFFERLTARRAAGTPSPRSTTCPAAGWTRCSSWSV